MSWPSRRPDAPPCTDELGLSEVMAIPESLSYKGNNRYGKASINKNANIVNIKLWYTPAVYILS